MIFQSNVENVSPQLIRQVSKELSDLVKDPPEGIQVYPNEEDITEIHATIDGPGEFLYLKRILRSPLSFQVSTVTQHYIPIVLTTLPTR